MLCSGAWCVLKGLFGKLFVMEQGSLGNLLVLVIRGVAHGCAAHCSGDPLSNPSFTLLPLIVVVAVSGLLRDVSHFLSAFLIVSFGLLNNNIFIQTVRAFRRAGFRNRRLRVKTFIT